MGDVEEKKVNISYEVLFELVRREKDRDELQQLEGTFYQDLVEYLNEKNQILREQKTKLETFSADESENSERQIENIRRLISKLYEIRERKIIMMALTKSKTKSNIVNTAAMLKEEQKLFNELVAVFDKYRQDVLVSLLMAKAPGDKDKPLETEEQKQKTKMVRFLHAVPKFLGKELEVYGPFEEEDVASLPEEIAEVLINKDRAEEISSEE